MRSDIIPGANFPDYELTKSTTATGFSAGQPWKSCGRTYVPLPSNAGRTGTSPRPNSRRRGSKAARNSFIRTAKRSSKLSVTKLSARSEHAEC
jgi:hypothetical protein